MRPIRLSVTLSLGLLTASVAGCASMLPGAASDELNESPTAENRAPATTPPTTPSSVANASSPQERPPAAQPPDQAVKDIPGLDPAVQAQLVENLKQTPPEMWPQILQSFRAAAAARTPKREPPSAGNALPTPAQTLDGAAAAAMVANGSGLPAHVYDSRQPRTAPGLPAAKSLADVFPAERDPQKGLASFNDSLDDPAPVRQVSYEETSSTADNAREALETAIRELEQPASGALAANETARRQIELRLLYLAAGRRDDALRPILGMTSAEQEYWSSQLYALSTWLDTERLPAADRRASETLVQLDRARAKLAEIGTLQVRNPQLCTRVDGYGAFTKFKEDTFKPKQDVVLYVELENFRSDATDTGFRTALSSRYRILDAQGREVVVHEFPTIEEVCQNRRRDYYISFRVQLPARIYDGRHTLQLTVEDTLAKKVGQTSIEFTIKE